MVATSLDGVLLYGVAASRPAASAVAKGTLYSATDTGVVSQSDGVSAWATFLSVSATGIPATIVDVKGDIIAATAADTVARLAAGANGKVLEAASGETTGLLWDYPPGYEFDYAQITANVTVAGTGTDVAGTTLVVSGGAVTYDGSTIVLIQFFAPGAAPALSAADRDLRLYLFDGTTNLGFFGYIQAGVSNSESPYRPVKLEHRVTPSAASHTYSVRGGRNGADAVVQAGAGGAGPAFLPAFIRITKV